MLQGRELDYVMDSVRSTWISSNGDYILRFEQAIAELTGVRHVIACNCGTSAFARVPACSAASAPMTRCSCRRSPSSRR